MSAPLFLTDAEVDEMCGELKTGAAKVRRLRTLGLIVNQKPNGRPLVVRSHAEAVLSGRAAAEAQQEVQPRPVTGNREAVLEMFRRKKAAA